MKAELRLISYNSVKIEYYLTRKNVKNINLRIRSSDGTVQVSAPYGIDTEYIDNFVLTNADFILNALKKYKKDSEKSKYFAKNRLNEGDELILLGQRLKIKIEQTENESVWTDGTYLYLRLSDANNYEIKRALLEKQLNIISEKIYNELIDRLFPVFNQLVKDKPILIIKNSVSRWGYCQPSKGVIMVNRQLICVPVPLIEYLILHELTHLIYPDHSKDFWRFMEKIIPDYKIRRKALQQYSFLLKK